MSPNAFTRAIAAALALITSLAGMVPAAHAQRGKAVILSVNDIYRIDGLNNGRTGGMARVRALRQDLEKKAPDLLFLHAGDFLSPSFLGRTYAGAQMIDLMNLMDGNPRSGVFDPRMFVAFGNHEFDGTHCGRDGPLSKLVKSSEFTYLASNLDFSRCERLSVLREATNIADNRIVTSGGLKIGLFGLTIAYPEYAEIVLDPVTTGCQQVEALRKKGADVVVALTHLAFRTDLELLGLGPDARPLPATERKCAVAPDLVIGGHDHVKLSLPSAAPRLFKADADAASAWVIEIEKRSAAPLKIAGRLVQLDERRVSDPLVQRVANHWLRQHDERFCLNDCMGLARDETRVCRRAVEDGQCLKEAYGKTASVIETEEIVNRSYETGFGDWLTDQIRQAGGADIAFLNAGSIRINQSLPAGTMLTRRHLEQMFPFRDKLILREVTGAALWKAMEHAVAQRGEGPWAHFSGMAVKLTEAGDPARVAAIKVRRGDGNTIEIGPQSLDKFKLASSAFILANGDGHGFDLCAGETAVTKCIAALETAPGWPATGDGADIVSLVRMKLKALDPARGLELAPDRRLCDRGQSDCRIEKW